MSGATLTAGQDRDRSAIGDKYKWNLADLYLDLAAWRTAKEAIARELPRLRTYQGKLGWSAQVLADALEDAGADAELVAHLREPGLHYRGCWCLDLLTGRE